MCVLCVQGIADYQRWLLGPDGSDEAEGGLAGWAAVLSAAAAPDLSS